MCDADVAIITVITCGGVNKRVLKTDSVLIDVYSDGLLIYGTVRENVDMKDTFLLDVIYITVIISL